jgi:hypothetical protein
MGIAKDGSHKSTYAPGVDLMATLTLFGEGCRGSLSQVGDVGGFVVLCECILVTLLYWVVAQLMQGYSNRCLFQKWTAMCMCWKRGWHAV